MKNLFFIVFFVVLVMSMRSFALPSDKVAKMRRGFESDFANAANDAESAPLSKRASLTNETRLAAVCETEISPSDIISSCIRIRYAKDTCYRTCITQFSVRIGAAYTCSDSESITKSIYVAIDEFEKCSSQIVCVNYRSDVDIFIRGCRAYVKACPIWWVICFFRFLMTIITIIVDIGCDVYVYISICIRLFSYHCYYIS